MASMSVKLPDIGEGVTQAEVVEWLVSVGDYVEEDAPLVAVMTDKATVEIPSLNAGTVTWIAGNVGDVLAIGSELVRIDTGATGQFEIAATQPQDVMGDTTAPNSVENPDGRPNAGARMAVLPVRLPDVGEGVTQAELVEWHVKVGDTVREDELLAAVMTDKATVEIPSLYNGKVVELGGAIGDVIAVGSSLVLIETSQAVGPVKPIVVNLDEKATTAQIELSPGVAASPPVISKQPANIAAGAAAPRPEGAQVLASPSVRARARGSGVDLRQVAGSGPAGRISHTDLDKVFAAPRSGDRAAVPPLRSARSGTREIKVIGLRRKIAERMALANSRIPHITVIEEIDVTALEDLREKLNASRGDKPKLTVLPFVTAALARAFIDHPEMNAHYDDDAGLVIQHAAAHLGIATMTDTGLVVPVLKNAEALGLFETAAEISRLSHAARSSKAARNELSGSTFTITSLGPLGAVATTPIINHPEVAILGINKMAVRPMWDGSGFQPRKMMNISASFDHRVIDGWDAATFVQKVKSLLEMPALIFVSDAI